ncbi:MAG: response regulator [Candidatus Omnitrophica bacterium]|nr:response regulator [Candidatus Omnitrophota bacterium]
METATPLTIMLIDDDQEISDATAALLSKRGYRVLHAGTGEEGLELLRSLRPDVIILDYRLPGKNGDVITDIIKSDVSTAGIPILMCTAQATLAQPLGGNPRLRKPDAYLIKPFTSAQLLEQVRLLTGG